MEQKPDTFRALIDRLGGVSGFSAKTGIGEFAAKKMRDRNSIAVRHWPTLIRVCASEGMDLCTDDLLRMALEDAA